MLILSPILLILSCFISVVSADNGCPESLLKTRIKNVDFPNQLMQIGANITQPNYNITQHCRAHSFTNPKWLDSTIIALKFQYVNYTYFAVLHYNSCNETTSKFDPPIILMSATRLDNSLHSGYVTNNADADFCHTCVDNLDMKFCETCNSSCRTNATNDLEYCYGPSVDECCQYLQDHDCALMCNASYYPDENSTCVEHICIRDQLCTDGECIDTDTNPTSYNCSCPNTHLGRNCSIPNPCNTTEQCNNNGNCNGMDTWPYFTCTCFMGIEGQNCEFNDLCDNSTNNPCKNSGNCTAMAADNYTCACMTGFSGYDCQTSKVVADSPVAAIAASVIVIIIVIVIIVIVVVIVCVLYFYLKRKRGKAEIAKKTSKVYPSNGNGTVDEKEPILEKEKL